MAFERFIVPDENQGDPKMAIHLFVAILAEYLAGEKNASQCQTAIETWLGVSLDTNEVQDISDTITYIDGGADLVNKKARLDEVYRVCIIAEHGGWYGTQASLRTRLSWSTPA